MLHHILPLSTMLHAAKHSSRMFQAICSESIDVIKLDLKAAGVNCREVTIALPVV